MFSLGIILYLLSQNLKHPYGNNLNIDFDKSITINDFKDSIKKRIKLNLKNRLSLDDYFDRPFFANN